MINIVKYD